MAAEWKAKFQQSLYDDANNSRPNVSNQLSIILGRLTLRREASIQHLKETGLVEALARENAEKQAKLEEERKTEQTRKTEYEKASKERQELIQKTKKLIAEREARVKQEEADIAAEKKALEELQAFEKKLSSLAAEKSKLAEEKAAVEKSKQTREDSEKKAAEAKAEEEKAAKAKAEAKAAQPTPVSQATTPQQTKQPIQSSTPTATPATSAPAPAATSAHANESMINAQKDFEKYQQRIQWIKTNVKDALAAQPKEIRNETMEIKMALRPKFGMLTNSKSQLVKCKKDVEAIFIKVKNGGNELLYNWTLNLFSKLLIEQSENEANAKLQNALPLAMLTVLLWNEFRELGDFVIPRIVKRCPLVLGYTCSIETASGRKKMGWKQEEDDKYESLEQYMGRMAGISAVWACITQSKLSATRDHPYPISHSWVFLSRQLNKPRDLVRPEDFAVVAAWWDMSALRLHDAYGKQADKLLNLTYLQYTEGRTEPAAMRLRGLGENWKETGVIEHAWEQLRP